MLETIDAAHAKDRIQTLIDETAESHRPVLITSKGNNAVLLSEEDRNAMQETLNLPSIPAMRESIVNGLNPPNTDFLTEEDFLNELDEESDN